MDVFINGEFLDERDARISVFDAGVQHAVGLFETMTARNGSVFRVDRHVERLVQSAAQLRLTDRLEVDPLAEAVIRTLERSGLDASRLRLTVTGGDLNMLRSTGVGPHDPTVFVVAQPVTEYPESFFTQGVQVILAPGRLNPWQATAGHKTLDYWTRIRALQEATVSGAAEALWLTPTAHVVSGSVSNLFLVVDGRLVTPPARGEQDPGQEIPPVLAGITREAIIELAGQTHIDVEYRLPVLEDVLAADEVFLTNSSWHVLPVTGVGLPVRRDELAHDEPPVHLEHRPIGDGAVGDVSADLRAALLDLVERETSLCTAGES